MADLDLSYRIDIQGVYNILHELEQAHIKLKNEPETTDLMDFVEDFLDKLEEVECIAESMGFNVTETLGYIKVKSYLELSGSHVTITSEEYEKLKFDSERLQNLDD